MVPRPSTSPGLLEHLLASHSSLPHSSEAGERGIPTPATPRASRMNRDVFELQGRIEEVHWWFAARRRVLLRLAAELLPEAGTVLDCGCGTGGNISAFPRAYRRIGVDPSPEAISIAAAKHRDVEFVLGIVPDDVAPELNAADLVLLTDVLEHVEDDAELLHRLVGGMKVGAHVIITVPAEPGLWSPHDVSHGHFRRYTAVTVARLWQGLPVELLLLAPFNYRLYPLVWLARRVTRALGRSAGRAGTDLDLPARPVNEALLRVFSGEAKRLAKALRGSASAPNIPGVSLLAVLRRRDLTVPENGDER